MLTHGIRGAAALGLLAVGASAGAAPSKNTALVRAEAQIGELAFEDAERSLDAARAVTGNDRDTLIRILELQGVVAGTLRKSDRSRERFKEMLALDPEHRLTGDYAPRVTTPFFEAKSWAAKNPPLKVVPASPRARPGRLERVAVSLLNDPLSMARKVRFHIQVDGGKWTAWDIPPHEGGAEVGVDAEALSWFAEVLGDRDAILASLASELAPIPERAPPAEGKVASTGPKLAPPPPPPLVRVPDAKPGTGSQASTTAKPDGSRFGVAPWIVMGAGAASALGGGVFALSYRSERNKFEGAARDGQGRITGMTQKDAQALEQRAQTDAMAANILFVGAGVLLATGLTLNLMDSNVEAAPAPGGVVVSGTF